ncbi:hypothetical protein L6R52_24730 [Myxococcota bacterium]|nr:hypothetical protein [Myxococcota bacterium]
MLLNVALTAAILVAFAAYAVRRLGLRRGRARARLTELLAWTEPAIILDSARTVVLLSWTGVIPDLAGLTQALADPSTSTLSTGLFRFIEVASVPPVVFHGAAWLYQTALLFAAVGVRTRTAAAIAGFAHVFLWSAAEAVLQHQGTPLVPLTLFTFALAPVASPSLLVYARALQEKRPFADVARYPIWLRHAVMFSIVMAHFDAGLEKLLHAGPGWANGTTLAGHLTMSGTELGRRITELPIEALSAISVVVLALELGFAMVLFHPKLRLPGALLALAFHRAVHAATGFSLEHVTVALLFVVTPHQLVQWLGSGGRRLRRSPPLPPLVSPESPPELTDGTGDLVARIGARVTLVAALLAFQLVPTVMRAGTFPFVAYDRFSNGHQHGEVFVARGLLFAGPDERSMEELDPAKVLGIGRWAFAQQLHDRYLSDHPELALYVPLRKIHCEQLLAKLAAGPRPDAKVLRLEADTVAAGEPSSAERRVLFSCTR